MHHLFQDLIKHTPKDHPDYIVLEKALKLSEENLKQYNTQSLTVHANNVRDSWFISYGVRGIKHTQSFTVQANNVSDCWFISYGVRGFKHTLEDHSDY